MQPQDTAYPHPSSEDAAGGDAAGTSTGTSSNDNNNNNGSVLSSPTVLTVGNLFENVPEATDGGKADEVIDMIARTDDLVVERIVSTNGYASRADDWYDQAESEFCTVLRGAARLLFQDEGGERGHVVDMQPGAWVVIPAHVKHKIEWTCPDVPTVWVAVKWKGK